MSLRVSLSGTAAERVRTRVRAVVAGPASHQEPPPCPQAGATPGYLSLCSMIWPGWPSSGCWPSAELLHGARISGSRAGQAELGGGPRGGGAAAARPRPRPLPPSRWWGSGVGQGGRGLRLVVQGLEQGVQLLLEDGALGGEQRQEWRCAAPLRRPAPGAWDPPSWP